MDDIFFKRLKLWHSKIDGQTDSWIKFVICYLIFDAYLTKFSESGYDDKKIKWFLNNDNQLKNIWNSNSKESIRLLKEMSPIYDMRPNSNKIVKLLDENNLEQIVKFIYQIRCNFFHGSKDSTDDRDNKLILNAGDFLKDTIDQWINQTQE